jgi:Helix-turn-helix domain
VLYYECPLVRGGHVKHNAIVHKNTLGIVASETRPQGRLVVDNMPNVFFFMKKEKLNIQDASGDRKYFTIIPNYILNHSTIYDREVYIQMKRITGEDGVCWTSVNTLAKQCGISENRLRKSIKYLLEHNWIVLSGKKLVGTKGGKQEVNEYKVADLWKLNIEYYEAKGGAPEVVPLAKGGAPNEQRGCTDEAKGGAPGEPKEEPFNKNPLSKIATQGVAEKDIREIIFTFRGNNPSYELLFKNTTQRAATSRLIEKYGIEKILGVTKFAVSISGQPYAPVVTTPYDLEKNLGKVIAFYKKGQEEKIKNQRYRIDDTDIILSADEHEKVQQAIAKSQDGKAVLILRDGALTINTMFIRYAKETDQPTQVQENRMQLEAVKQEQQRPNYSGGGMLKGHNDYYASIGKEHGPDCLCVDMGKINKSFSLEGREYENRF